MPIGALIASDRHSFSWQMAGARSLARQTPIPAKRLQHKRFCNIELHEPNALSADSSVRDSSGGCLSAHQIPESKRLRSSPKRESNQASVCLRQAPPVRAMTLRGNPG